MKPKPTPGAPLGSRNAAKPRRLHRIALNARIDPAAARLLTAYAREHASLGRALDTLIFSQLEPHNTTLSVQR